jgi:hypothetical protein
MNRFAAAWRYALDLYLGDLGFRAALICYAVGFWIFAIGALLWIANDGAPAGVRALLTGLFLNVGLVIVVFLTYPVVRCGYRATDRTRFRSSFLRMFVPAAIGLISPIYLMLLVASFIRYMAGPAFLGFN